jgi:peptidoglycan/xylan/chitin deacetylase (PgdA/CDA1 family)
MKTVPESEFKDMNRRKFIGMATGSMLTARSLFAERARRKKVHLVTLSFDDGFRKSFEKIASIYEEFGLPACLNVLAGGHQPDFVWPTEYTKGIPNGDFALWNELKERGHEIMPHGYRHANLAGMAQDKARGLIRRCLDVFSEELTGFDPRKAVFNFPFNASTPELEAWLPGQVMAFRTGYEGINPLPGKNTVRLTCSAFGPGNCEEHLDGEIDRLLGLPEGWLIYNTHGVDGEGWGPMRSSYLSKLLERLLKIETVRVVPAAMALLEAREGGETG